MQLAYDEIVDFITSSPTPQQIIDHQPSEETRDKVFELLHRKKTTGLNDDEDAELRHYLELEHIMRLAKARAHQLSDGKIGRCRSPG